MQNRDRDPRISREEKHELIARGGKAIPPVDCPACTKTYLDGVQLNKFWCQSYVDVRIRCCYRPPVKAAILDAILLELRPSGRSLGIKDSTKVTKDWLLMILSTLNADHRFFAPDYYPNAVSAYTLDIAVQGILNGVPGFRSQNVAVQRAQANI